MGSPGPAEASSRPYTGKAHELVPEFSNKACDYKEFKKRVLLYEKKMSLAGRAKETAFNIMAVLRGRAWDAVEDLSMAELEAEDGTSVLVKRLDSVFKYDAITELPNDFETFFMHTRRARNQTIQEYTADFERNLRKLEAHNVKLPDKVTGWFWMVLPRRAGLKQDQRQMVMTTLSAETMNLETVRKALNFVIGQDNMPDASSASPTKSRGKDHSIYYTMTRTCSHSMTSMTWTMRRTTWTTMRLKRTQRTSMTRTRRTTPSMQQRNLRWSMTRCMLPMSRHDNA